MLRDLFLGFMRLHVLHHAAEAPVFGLEMIRELARHGYDVSPGTLYPLLHALETEGLLVSERAVVEGRVRRYYRATEAGRQRLAEAVLKVRELASEIDAGPEGGS